MNPLAIFSGPWGPLLRLGLLAVVAATLFLTGYVKGLRHEQKVLEAYQARVELAVEKQAVHTAQVVSQQKGITAKITGDYQENIYAIRRAYNARFANRGMQHPTTSGSPMPAVSSAPRSVDEIPPDAIPLAGQCAETTEQLVALQEWIRKQQGIK